jgi:RNA polymerase sigma factor (sigma-70 family)
MVDSKTVESVFSSALHKSTPDERAAYLDEACGDDTELRERVETLLKADNDLDEADIVMSIPPDRLLALDEALGKLADEEPQKAELIKLRYFAGLTLEQAADAIGVSRATATRHWTYARAWLYDAVSKSEDSR